MNKKDKPLFYRIYTFACNKLLREKEKISDYTIVQFEFYLYYVKAFQKKQSADSNVRLAEKALKRFWI